MLELFLMASFQWGEGEHKQALVSYYVQVTNISDGFNP